MGIAALITECTLRGTSAIAADGLPKFCLVLINRRPSAVIALERGTLQIAGFLVTCRQGKIQGGRNKGIALPYGSIDMVAGFLSSVTNLLADAAADVAAVAANFCPLAE